MSRLINANRINNMQAPKLKGSVNILLMDAKTGHIDEEIKGTNIITNALNTIFASNYFGATEFNDLFPIIKNLLGGVLCFQQQLTAEASNIYPPTHNVNPVIAHAGQTNYDQTTDDSTRGTPNATESGEITNGYKLVFDFLSTQGNGEFSTVSLTHKDTGDFWLFNGQKFKPFGSLTKNQNYQWDEGKAPQFFDTTNNIAYQFVQNNSSDLTIWKIENMGILSNISVTQPRPTQTRAASLTQTSHTVALTRNARYYLYLYKEAAQEVHALYCSGSTIERIIIDLTDFSTSSDSLTVTGADMAPVDSWLGTYSYSVPAIWPDKNGYIYIRKNGNAAVYKIKYSDPTDKQEIAISALDNGALNAMGISGCGNFGILPNAGLLVGGNTAYTCGRVDADFGHSWNGSQHLRASEINGNQIIFFDPRENWVGATALIGNVINKLYLGTIFNLPQPISKTSAQTMKIVYEITKAGGS